MSHRFPTLVAEYQDSEIFVSSSTVSDFLVASGAVTLAASLEVLVVLVLALEALHEGI